jgi:hypothetical protein
MKGRGGGSIIDITSRVCVRGSSLHGLVCRFKGRGVALTKSASVSWHPITFASMQLYPP